MANRSLLHKTKLDEFKQWLEDSGYKLLRPYVLEFEVLRWKGEIGKPMPIVFSKLDVERYRWLTYDHDDAEQRKRCREIWDCGCVMSYSALSVYIDAAMAGGEK